MIQARRFNRSVYPSTNNSSMMNTDSESTNATTVCPIESETASEVASIHGDNNDDSISVASESTNDVTPAPVTPKKLGRPPKNVSAAKGKKATTPASRKRKATEKDDEENDDGDDSGSEMAADDSHHANHTGNGTHQANIAAAVGAANDLLDEDERLGPEELQKKIDKSSRQLIKRREELTFVTNCVRVTDLGQDRYRRRYWQFAHASGIYVEGLESCEPWKLATEGLPHYDEDGRPPVLKKMKIEDLDSDSDDEDDSKVDIESEVKPNVNGNNNDTVKKEEESKEEMQDTLMKLGSDNMLSTPKVELTDYEKKLLPKVTPNGDKLNMFNHSSHFNMQLSPVR